MNSVKLLKKIDMRLIQGLVMALIFVFFLYLFYYFYGQFSGYQKMKQQKRQGKIEAAVVQAPEFFNFTPAKENIQQYRLFTFKEKKDAAVPAEPGDMPFQDNAPGGSGNYRILGVVKKDKLFLVVRFISGNKIRLFAEGETIDNRSRVKKLTYKQAVIANSSGGQKVHKIFKVEPITIFKQKSKGTGKK